MPNLVFTGTESTYKTALSSKLARERQWPLSPEFARAYLESDPFMQEEWDVVHLPQEHWERIAQGQLEQQRTFGYFEPSPRDVVLFDTDGLTLHIWGLDKYGVDRDSFLEVPPKTTYVLCAPTNEAEEDPLRTDAHRRWELHERYQELLGSLKLPYLLLDAPDFGARYNQLRAHLAALGL